jgi:hypothetical protein
MWTLTLFCRNASDVERYAGDLAQIGQTVIEFMVADGAGVVA